MTPVQRIENLRCENRFDRPDYSEQTPSTIRHANGSLLASFDRAFLAAAMRHTLVAYGVDLAPAKEAA